MTVIRRSDEEYPTDPEGWPLREGCYALVRGREYRGLAGYRAPDVYGIVSYVYQDAKGWVVEVTPWKGGHSAAGRPDHVYLRKPPTFRTAEESAAYEEVRRRLAEAAKRRRHPRAPIRDNKRGRGIQVDRQKEAKS